ncbi:MAG: hypothetical protein HKN58_01110, partial [Xanthomonadales bacterium]|nr:hypothetical protein [Xanthomonadales bacterium]
DLPFKANDLSGQEYYARNNASHNGGIQKYGFDLGAKRYNADLGGWSMLTLPWSSYDLDPRNEYHVVYGKPVYAMEAGTVVGCWRNAPENAQSARSDEGFGVKEENFLHEKLRTGYMPGGGNILWVDHADGSRALYAHFQPGSIPAALCPIEKSLFNQPNTEGAETTLAQADQVAVERGQYLGRVGNAGNSTGPHLHIHVERAGAAELLRFNHGLATPLNGGDADTDQWTAFKGEPIPPGPTLFWPPRSKGAEYARHGLPSGQFQKWFMHLSDSGYWPTWLDLFSSSGQNYVNMVWRPAKGRWRAWVGIDGNSFQQNFTNSRDDKFYPVLADVALWGGQPRYAAIYREHEPGQFRLRFGLSDEQAEAEFAYATKQGYVPESSSVVSINDQRRHTVLYRKGQVGSFWTRSNMTADEYQQAWQENSAAGRQLRFVDVYRHNNRPYFSAIFTERPKGETIGRHGLTGASYQDAFELASQAGYGVQAVAGYDGASSRRYAAGWFKGPGAQPAAVASVALVEPETSGTPPPEVAADDAESAEPESARDLLRGFLESKLDEAVGETRVSERLRHKDRAVSSSADEGGDIIDRQAARAALSGAR